MTEQGPEPKLTNISPYGTWRKSPMGLAGRDPIFFAQLASEIETFHPESKSLIEDTCMSCHAVQGHRQHAIDNFAESGACTPLARSALDAVPYPADNPTAHLAKYAALGRDGVACSTCHSMVLGKDASQKVADGAQNACVAERQKVLNPGLTGLAKTFTGNFLVAEPADLYGPFEDPKKKPMEAATGMEVAHSTHVKSSEICASCHTVHLPVLHRGKIVGHTYEQATYPEWAFSAYRTGETVDGVLPGAKAPRRSPARIATCPRRTRRARPIAARSPASRNTHPSRRPSSHCLPRTSISNLETASPSTRWWGSTCSSPRWPSNSPTCSAFAPRTRCCRRAGASIRSSPPSARCWSKRRTPPISAWPR
ncbi:hypothetical protein [Methyloceanibacter marginalis]|uniref:hypothetical protein n=1 Tax=Methyloceanibacter marginalis TaxID=1774971 RepID=UPI000B2DBA88|nr:hypothetical protein [Methyloceanibacter marginalis]